MPEPGSNSSAVSLILRGNTKGKGNTADKFALKMYSGFLNF